jgi:hypothetical protein
LSKSYNFKAVQDNEPQNFGNTIYLNRQPGYINFNFYLDVDNNGLSNCSPEMSCYNPDKAIEIDFLIDLIDSNGKYIVQN